jgi:glycosyltransferase involved in cell wall biosynthesis
LKIFCGLLRRGVACYNEPVKLTVFIPAYNEAATIGGVIAAIPRKIHGIGEIKIFVVDDGSNDGTIEAVERAGKAAEHVSTSDVAPTFDVETTSKVEIVQIKHNRGLANAFRVGMAKSLTDGADVIAHLDADGQYDPGEIPKLLAPILDDSADMVIGDRQVARLAFMRPVKKYGNMAGSWFLRTLSGLEVNDVSSGFRAYTADAAAKLKITSAHTYTHESLIRARRLGLRIVQVPITFSERKNGPSRLISGNLAVFKHIIKSAGGIIGAWRSTK